MHEVLTADNIEKMHLKYRKLDQHRKMKHKFVPGYVVVFFFHLQIVTRKLRKAQLDFYWRIDALFCLSSHLVLLFNT